MTGLFKRLTAAAMAFSAGVSLLAASAAAASGAPDPHRLLTSNNPDNYAVIELDGNHITISGKFACDTVIDAGGNYHSNDEMPEIIYHDDGTFECGVISEWWETPNHQSRPCVYITFENAWDMSYVMAHGDDGWYFPDNGLAELNAEKLENIQAAAPEAAAYYLSADANPAEIEETLSELERLVREICGDERDDYKKAYLLNLWIGENIYYDHDASETEVTTDTVAVHNVIERRRTTCAGFANLYSALLETAGIRSVNIKGAVLGEKDECMELPAGGQLHEFNAFWYGDESRWVWADPAWTSVHDYAGGEYRPGYICYQYFDITDEALALNHRADRAEERSYLKALEAISPQPDADTAETGRNPVPYVIIGAAGVIITVTGIILLKNTDRKDEQK